MSLGTPGDPPKPSRSEHEKAAYQDGWNAAATGADRLSRPNYPTYEERKAFDEGWTNRYNLGLLGDSDQTN